MQFNEKASCDYHAIPLGHLLPTLRKRVVILDSNLSVDRIEVALQSYNLDLLPRIHDFEDIVVCAGCWSKILSGEAINPFICSIDFLQIEKVGKEEYLRVLELLDGDKSHYGILGNQTSSSEGDRGFGLLLTRNGQYTQHIRFVIPGGKNNPLLSASLSNWFRSRFGLTRPSRSKLSPTAISADTAQEFLPDNRAVRDSAELQVVQGGSVTDHSLSSQPTSLPTPPSAMSSGASHMPWTHTSNCVNYSTSSAPQVPIAQMTPETSIRMHTPTGYHNNAPSNVPAGPIKTSSIKSSNIPEKRSKSSGKNTMKNQDFNRSITAVEGESAAPPASHAGHNQNAHPSVVSQHGSRASQGPGPQQSDDQRQPVAVAGASSLNNAVNPRKRPFDHYDEAITQLRELDESRERLIRDIEVVARNEKSAVDEEERAATSEADTASKRDTLENLISRLPEMAESQRHAIEKMDVKKHAVEKRLNQAKTKRRKADEEGNEVDKKLTAVRELMKKLGYANTEGSI